MSTGLFEFFLKLLLQASSPARAISTVAALIVAAFVAGPPAQAGNEIRVNVDEASVVELAAAPSMVIVGNPMIADATVHHGNILVIHGKNYGSTNVIVLDHDSQQIANLSLSVVSSGGYELSLHRGSGRVSFNCAPLCEYEMNVGDEIGNFERIQDQVGKKTKHTTGAVEAPGEVE